MAEAHVQFAGQMQFAKTAQLCAATLAIDAEAADLCKGLTEEQLSSSTRPGSWSIAQNLSHLRTTTAVFLPAVDHALELSRQRQLLSDGPFWLGLYGRLLVSQMDGRPMFKMRAPQALQPQLLPSAGLELEHFLISQLAMRKRIQDAEGVSLTALRFSSPVAKYIRLNLLECFSVLNAHSRRHIRQANRVRRTLIG
jgi:hypothetical protein